MSIDDALITTAKTALKLEAEAVQAQIDKIDGQFVKACHLILDCKGRVIVTGMGKSGHIARKIAATLASTGTPAFFVHPGEASHGDLGMITNQDVVLALSNSGETQEVLTLLPLLKRLGVPLLSMTGNEFSTLAKSASVHIHVEIPNEACPLGLSPTSSTTASLAMGDALALSLLDVRKFTAEDFAFSHPGGSLGRRLLLRVEDIMHTGPRIPKVSPKTTLREALLEISGKGFGMTSVIGDSDKLLGIYTDGDLRRTLDKTSDIENTLIEQVMNPDCLKIKPQALAAEALKLMEDKQISGLLVVGDAENLVGVLHMHDLLHAGVV